MLDQFLSRFFSSWMVFPVLVVALLALSEFGWRVGLARSRTTSEKTKESGSVPAARLTLLGLLLGFSFPMAVSRHDTRRRLVVREANSINTTARRARLLPEPQAINVARLLREYLALRIEAHRETKFWERFEALRKSSAPTCTNASGMSGVTHFLRDFCFRLSSPWSSQLMTDIDTPRGGLITVDQRPLLELNDSLK